VVHSSIPTSSMLVVLVGGVVPFGHDDEAIFGLEWGISNSGFVNVESKRKFMIVHSVVDLGIYVESSMTECILNFLIGDEVMHMILFKSFIHFALFGGARVHGEVMMMVMTM
jgi:hypothetical protein